MSQDLLTVQKLSQSYYLKKSFKFFLSLSIFSLCLSYHSWILFFLRYTTIFHSNKNYMFLVCNGILVFLARNSDFVSSPFKDTTDILEDADEINRENLQLDHHQDIIQPECSEMKNDLEEKEKELDVQLLMTHGQDHYEGEVEEEEEEEEEKELEVQLLMTQGHDHYEEEEEDYEANGLLSGDELQKKFDDFIKKVKQQIRIEAYQLQLHAY